MAGCSDRSTDAENAGKAGLSPEALVKAQLIHKNDAEFRDVTTYPGNVSCGEVSSAGAWGEGEGFRRFIVRNDRADTAPSDDDWAIFCNEDPAAAMQSRFGIGPLDEAHPELLTVHRQLQELDLALSSYLADLKGYPPSEPGLQSLVEVGYIDKLPDDPWGRPYVYERPRGLHGAAPNYQLTTLGKDGIEGGQGEDADIGNRHLHYLNHIANLQ